MIVGRVIDKQNQPVEGAHVRLHAIPERDVNAESTTQPDGTYSLVITGYLSTNLFLEITRPHFQTIQLEFNSGEVRELQNTGTLAIPTITLTRQVSPAFWISIAVFIGMLILIAMGRLHNTLASLAGAATVFAVSYLGAALRPDLFIFDFHRALEYVDWNVIFLIMGMMIVIAVIERTGIFQWLAYFAYRLSRGRVWLLMIILMVITGVTSAALDNVTTMLLMTPISIQIALALGVNPLALLVPEVMASNVAGISTLIGTPTNILIGSFAQISFNDFLIELTPGVLISLTALILYSRWIYRTELISLSVAPAVLVEKLTQRAHITEPDHLRKAGWVGLGMLILFTDVTH